MRNRETLVNWTLWSLILELLRSAAIISQEKLWVYRGGENENCLMAEVRVPIFHASYFFYDFKMREFWREFQFSQEFLSIWNYAQWMKKLLFYLPDLWWIKILDEINQEFSDINANFRGKTVNSWGSPFPWQSLGRRRLLTYLHNWISVFRAQLSRVFKGCRICVKAVDFRFFLF